jgi:DNA adenine methylase
MQGMLRAIHEWMHFHGCLPAVLGKDMESSSGEGMMITQPIKWHGGKHYLASKIVELIPQHIHYVEPYAGGLSVLLAKDPEGVSEAVNDINKDLSLFWRVLQIETLFAEFKRRVEATAFSEVEYELAVAELASETTTVSRAWAFFVCCRQSLAGRMKDFATLSRTRVRRGMNEQASAWLTAVEGLPAVHARLKRVVILDRDALDVIRQQDGPDTCFYCDPPYLPETRATTGEYAHEMTIGEHLALLGVLSTIEGKFLLSGYRSEMYDDQAKKCGWRRKDFSLPNNAAGGASKRTMTECVWVNF